MGLVALFLPLIGCEPPRFMPPTAEVQPSPDQIENLADLEAEVGVSDVPVPLAVVIEAESISEMGAAKTGALGESLSADDMLKLMAESERGAIAGIDADVQPPVIVAPMANEEASLPVSQSYVATLTRSVGPVRSSVALLVPLTGRGSDLGRAMLNSAQLALFDSFDLDTNLIIKDTTGSPERAAIVAGEALNEGAQLLIGPLFSESVRAAAPIARRHGVPMIGFSNDRSLAGDGVYVFGFTPDQQIRRIVSYAASSGLRRIIALVPYNEYGRAVAVALQESVEKSSLSIWQVEYFSPDGADSTEVVRRIAAIYKTPGAPSQPPLDCVLIAAGGQQLRALATLFPYFDIETTNVRLLGTELWHNESILGEPALQGGWFAAPPTGAWARFERHYENGFDAPPPSRAALAYDAVSLAGVLIRTAHTEEAYSTVSTGLVATNGFAGIQGMFRFGRNGVVERVLTVYKVTADGFQVIDAPRREFVGEPM